MICTFCGTDNREGNRFCGMCGVRLERRKVERRVHHGASLKCDSCGQANEPGYKFCGMCGTRVDRRVSERRGAPVSEQARSQAGGSVLVAAPNAVGTARPAVENARAGLRQRSGDVLPETRTAFRTSPSDLRVDRAERTGIQGPSFLGLSDEPEEDTTYLLEEESSSHSGLRKLVLLVILAAIVGLIFVQYRSSLHANPKAEPSHSSPQGQNQPSPATTSPQQQSLAPDSTAPPAGPGEPNAQPGAQDPPAAAPSRQNESTPQVTPAKAETLLAEDPEPADAAEPSRSDAPDVRAKHQDSSAIDNALNAPVPAEEKPSPTLTRAQQFLHGRGVPQNCEQGLVYLRAAAQKNEPAAAVQMGALYASGHCVHQDRVMAYRWFNSAHELQPANQWIIKNMDLLWGQMTEQERRLAGY